MHLHRTLRRPEIPGATCIGVKFNRDAASQINLTVLCRLALKPTGAALIRQGQNIDAERFADGLVHGHQRIAKTKHQRDDDQQFAKHAAVVVDERD